MKFACLGEMHAPPIAKPRSPHASSIRPAVSSWSGFLKTLPNVRLFVGCAAFRFACISATVALISSTGRGSSRISARATTWPRSSAERRYWRPSSSGVSQRVPSASATSARSSTADMSLPYAPAFIQTAPPTVPGMAHANSKPPSPAARARWRQTASGAPPPASRPSSAAAAASSPPSLSASPWEAAVGHEQVRPEPDRRDRNAPVRGPAQELDQVVGVSGVANQRAGPPVPSVV